VRLVLIAPAFVRSVVLPRWFNESVGPWGNRLAAHHRQGTSGTRHCVHPEENYVRHVSLRVSAPNSSRLKSTAQLLGPLRIISPPATRSISALDNRYQLLTAQGLNKPRPAISSNLLDGIGNGVQGVQAANTGITSLQSLVSSAKSIATSAAEPGRLQHQVQRDSTRPCVTCDGHEPDWRPRRARRHAAPAVLNATTRHRAAIPARPCCRAPRAPSSNDLATAITTATRSSSRHDVHFVAGHHHTGTSQRGRGHVGLGAVTDRALPAPGWQSTWRWRRGSAAR